MFTGQGYFYDQIIFRRKPKILIVFIQIYGKYNVAAKKLEMTLIRLHKICV